MRGWKRSVLAVLVGALVATLVPAPAAEATTPHQRLRPVYLALGDSWAAGVGATPADEQGYVPQLADVARDELDCARRWWGRDRPGCGRLQLKNLAVSGATTDTLIEEQLRDAVKLLLRRNRDFDRRNDVELVTLHIGGNDIVQPLLQTCLTPGGGLSEDCLSTIAAELGEYADNLTKILAALRFAGGRDTIIIIGTYDNAIPSCYLADVPGAETLGALALEGTDELPGLHDVMRQVAGRFDVEVAEIFGELEDPEDWVGGQDCLHPDDSGYDVVTEQFAAILR